MSKKKDLDALPESAHGEDIVREVMSELTAEDLKQIPSPKKTRIPLTHRTGAKVIAFMMTILMTAITIFSVLGAIFLVLEDVYTTPKSEFHSEVFSSLAQDVAYNALNLVLSDRIDEAEDIVRYKNLFGIAINMHGEQELRWEYYNIDLRVNSSEDYESKWYLDQDGVIRPLHAMGDDDASSIVYVKVYILPQLTVQDDFHLADCVINTMYALRYWIYAIAAAALLLTILCFVFLMRASGWRGGMDEPQPGWGTWVPFDILTAALFIAVCLLLMIADEASYFHSAIKQVAVWSVCGASIAVLCLGWCMSAATRLKLGNWWKKLAVVWVVFGAVRLLKLMLRFTWRTLRRSCEIATALIRSLPLVWKTAVVCVAVLLVDLLSIVVFQWDSDMLLITWVLLHGAVFAFVLYIALILRRLKKGGEALAAGDLSYQVDTKWMLSDFKAHAENLSSIGVGMTAAVEQRLKSERMKTELITNVSHDIKTPLTSIINYSDLIEKEPCENEKITEYAAVLHRQSERLKRLIDDLVEASKASTGNLDVQLAPCEVGVMLSQTAGEYEQRLEQCKLTLVTKQPEQPVRIMADGRRLWRVFDNLMNNICKYAMPGTRVYLTVEKNDNEAVIAFKNTSREPLDLSADELMERFVRGDAARNSEGNGLGLSIAKSLVQLQNGTMELTVDGDLFKAILHFNAI